MTPTRQQHLSCHRLAQHAPVLHQAAHGEKQCKQTPQSALIQGSPESLVPFACISTSKATGSPSPGTLVVSPQAIPAIAVPAGVAVLAFAASKAPARILAEPTRPAALRLSSDIPRTLALQLSLLSWPALLWYLSIMPSPGDLPAVSVVAPVIAMFTAIFLLLPLLVSAATLFGRLSGAAMLPWSVPISPARSPFPVPTAAP